jgi:hypothetical protein
MDATMNMNKANQHSTMHYDTHSREPLVSYIMAAKNFEQYVGEAIDSVLGQKYPNLELIVVDDGSTDQTAEIIRAKAAGDSRLHALFNAQSVLPSLARNQAAAVARGTYLAILDADDLCLPERTAAQVEFLETHPQVAAVGSQAEIIDAQGRTLGVKRKPTDSSDMRFVMLVQSALIHSSLMIRKSIFDELGGYREAFPFAEDYDLCSRILERHELANVDQVLIKFRSLSGGATTQSASSLIQQKSSMAVTMRNCGPFLPLSPKRTKELTDVLNEKKMTLAQTIRGLRTFRKLAHEYIEQTHASPESRQHIGIMVKNKQRTIMISFVKRILRGRLG